MNNIKNNDPRFGMIVSLGVLLAALWLVIAYGAFADAQKEKYETRVIPGAVNVGARPATTMPTVVVTTREVKAAPMISGSAVRGYARYGHATRPKVEQSGGYRLYTTSSATIHSVGSGFGGGSKTIGGVSSTASQSGYQGVSPVSIPSIAVATPKRTVLSVAYTSPISAIEQQTETLTAMAAPMRKGVIRKAKPTGAGEPGDVVEKDGETWYWDEDESDWVNTTPVGTIRNINGYEEQWNGTAWVRVGLPDAGTPIGTIPWLMLLLAAAGYGYYVAKRKQTTK